MTQEEKSLILRDICGRLPYGITIYRITDNSTHRIQYSDITDNIDQFSHFLECSGIENIKPYLRPMSSMTEEEVKEIQKINWQFCKSENVECFVGAEDDGYCSISQMADILKYLNAHHFDYRDLIPMGLALEAPEDMYKI